MMNMEAEQAMAPEMEGAAMNPQPEMAAQGGPTMIPDDGGMEEEDFAKEVQANLEEHLNSLPGEAKEFLSEWVTTPEFVTALEIINGPVVGDYFRRYVDPQKKAVIQRVSSQQGQPQQGAPAPAQAGPQIAPAQP